MSVLESGTTPGVTADQIPNFPETTGNRIQKVFGLIKENVHDRLKNIIIPFLPMQDPTDNSIWILDLKGIIQDGENDPLRGFVTLYSVPRAEINIVRTHKENKEGQYTPREEIDNDKIHKSEIKDLSQIFTLGKLKSMQHATAKHVVDNRVTEETPFEIITAMETKLRSLFGITEKILTNPA